ncbi:MAG: restriction endonuclease subunit S [Thermoanaerobaculaceae bacterium]|nr:restriction endonuclease subunit S [Thermoanaerobaculaceae bacterium]MDI9621803.1 restriction endonuclease subunit S [Acidobacteriota bacterium]NLH10200.1 restriction endonuclease subunit S [Holophagae bacterium]
MGGEWRNRTLGELTENFDSVRVPVKEADRRIGPYPYYGASGVVDHVDGYLFDGEYLLIAEDGENLRTRTTSIAFLARGKFWVNNHAHIVRGNDEADTRFLMYSLAVTDITGYLTGSTMPKLTQGNMNRIPLLTPPLPEQRAIAHILGTLDDKIELNRRMSETLEAMARALFKSWFVDFDPVRAKAEGSWRRGQSLPGLPAHLYDLFPARLVVSELGDIPEGWEVVPAGSLFEVAIGKTPPRKEHHWFSTDPQDVPWMSIKDLGQAGVFISEVSEYLTSAAVDRFRVRRIPDGAVVLSFKLTVGRVAITDGEMLSNEAIAHFLPRDGTYLSAPFTFSYLRQFEYESLGSTSSIAIAVNSANVRTIPVIVPSEKEHEAFRHMVWPTFRRLRGLQRESLNLAALRDTLLPKLISGELRVDDAESIIGSAM